MSGFNLPDGVSLSDIPGNRPSDIAYDNAYNDDEGYGRAVRAQFLEKHLVGVVGRDRLSIDQFLALDPDVLCDVAHALDLDGVETREEYAERMVEAGIPADDDRNDDSEPFE